MSTKIEWAQETWNPIVGCSKVSEACQNCYAEKMANRLAGQAIAKSKKLLCDPAQVPGIGKYIHVIGPDGKWNTSAYLDADTLIKPYDWEKPRRIFVCSMGDLFHEDLTFNEIYHVFDIIYDNPQHTYLILTKRPLRALEYLHYYGFEEFGSQIWLGVTTENQKRYNERWSIAQQIPALKLFVSGEPLLGPIDFSGYEEKPDWFIVGGESGPGARPMHPDWARSIRDQCVTAKVPFYFKQWGEWAALCAKPIGSNILKGNPLSLLPWGDMGPKVFKIGKNKAGRHLDGKIWDEYPKVND